MSPDRPDDTRSSERDFAALWSSDEATRSFAPTPTGVPVDLPFLFSANQRFGPYLIIRPLGKGGMGQVYEAEEVDSGRRVALKLLSRGLGDDEERERFLREGRLAASLSHPNCVYVFGTSEIQGFPVIAMELVPEGTLKDRVIPGTPMAPAAAVDAVLQVVAGLDAAASIGILHRDVKPSNCFVHRGGRVLVGDFGLSVASARHGSERIGTILGTPGFASPEQLRGDELDVRSDIYSVGATLFYLLTGRAPFEDTRTTGLIEQVASAPPPALDVRRPDLPRRLAQIVAKCLSKKAPDRFESYAALRASLEPFGSARVVQGPLWRRSVAGLIDSYVTSIPAMPIVAVFALQPLSPSHRLHAVVVSSVLVASRVVYYGLLEGIWGAAAGKALLGLRVVDAGLAPPGARRGALRALAFALPSQIIVEAITWPIVRHVPDVSIAFLNPVTGLAYVAIMFCTVRPSNGYAALHDRWSRTRVVKRRVRAEARAAGEALRAVETTPIEGTQRVGPYQVEDAVRLPVEAPRVAVGFDDRLQRRVWIELLPPGSPPLPVARRDLDRPARLRWLGGRRDGPDCWDAYEAIDGRPLGDVASSPHRWSRVRHWLDDLGRELITGLSDGLLPRLHPDRVWIGRDDRARLLEWPDPGAASSEEPPGSTAPALAGVQQLLYAAAVAPLLGVRPADADARTPDVPLPHAARDLLLKLRAAKFSESDALAGALETAIASPATVPRTKRAAQIAVTAAFPVVITVIAVGAKVGKLTTGSGTHGKDLLSTAFTVLVGTCTIPMFFSFIGAAVTASGFTFRPFGAMLVNRRGRRASRLRALWRAAVTWSPIVVTLMLYAGRLGPTVMTRATVALQCAVMLGMAAAAGWAIRYPPRSIQDRLSGTWIVPR